MFLYNLEIQSVKINNNNKKKKKTTSHSRKVENGLPVPEETLLFVGGSDCWSFLVIITTQYMHPLYERSEFSSQLSFLKGLKVKCIYF